MQFYRLRLTTYAAAKAPLLSLLTVTTRKPENTLHSRNERSDRSELARSIQGILTDTITNDNVLCCLLYLSAIFLAEERYFLSVLILI